MAKLDSDCPYEKHATCGFERLLQTRGTHKLFLSFYKNMDPYNFDQCDYLLSWKTCSVTVMMNLKALPGSKSTEQIHRGKIPRVRAFHERTGQGHPELADKENL